MRVTLVVNRQDAVSETFQRSLASVLATDGHEVTVHSLRAGTGPVPQVEGVGTSTGLPPLRVRSASVALRRLIRSPNHGLATAARRALAEYGFSARAVRAALGAGPLIDTCPDVIHLGFSGVGVALADALSLVPEPRLVVSCRGTDELVHPVLDPERAAGLSALLGRVDLVHVVAGVVRDAVVVLGAPADRIRVIRPAVDLERWTPRRAGPDGPGLQLVAVARLQPAKGLDDLIGAVASIRESGTDARLRIVGDGPHRDSLRLRILRSQLGGTVTLVGPLPPAAVRDEVARADVFVSASLTEGISNVVLEAMATGVPVISTAVGGMAEVIHHDIDGWLVPSGRPDRLAAALQFADRHPESRAVVAAAGRRRVEEAFALERQRDELVALYRELGAADLTGPSRRIAAREDRR